MGVTKDILSNAEVDIIVARLERARKLVVPNSTRFEDGRTALYVKDVGALTISHCAQAARIEELEAELLPLRNRTSGPTSTSIDPPYQSPVCPVCHQRHDTTRCT